jgi:transposase
VNKNDPNDARSVAVTALRSRTLREVAPDDHSAVLKMWARRHRDLGRSRTQTACRLHAALCELVPGGISKEITAAHAARVLEQLTPCGAVQQARWELAADLLDDLRRADERLREVNKKLNAAVQPADTSLTEIFGVGPVIAATVIGEVADVSRFAGRDGFAACNGTAPIEVSSGKRKVHRLSRRGNRKLNHAAHMTAVTQVRYPHSQGRAYYDKKLAEGKTAKEALRALKRQVSDAFYKHLKADAARGAQGPGGQTGNDSVASAAGSHPKCQLFGKATPGPQPTLRPQPKPTRKPTSQTRRKSPQALDTKRLRSARTSAWFRSRQWPSRSEHSVPAFGAGPDQRHLSGHPWRSTLSIALQPHGFIGRGPGSAQLAPPAREAPGRGRRSTGSRAAPRVCR